MCDKNFGFSLNSLHCNSINRAMSIILYLHLQADSNTRPLVPIKYYSQPPASNKQFTMQIRVDNSSVDLLQHNVIRPVQWGTLNSRPLPSMEAALQLRSSVLLSIIPMDRVLEHLRSGQRVGEMSAIAVYCGLCTFKNNSAYRQTARQHP